VTPAIDDREVVETSEREPASALDAPVVEIVEAGGLYRHYERHAA